MVKRNPHFKKLRHILKSGYPVRQMSWFTRISSSKCPNNNYISATTSIFHTNSNAWKTLTDPNWPLFNHQYFVVDRSALLLHIQAVPFSSINGKLRQCPRFAVVFRVRFHPAIFKSFHNSAKHQLKSLHPSVILL